VSEFLVTTSGHSVVPGLYGPENLLNIGGLSWTDQQGVADTAGKRFRIRQGKTITFRVPVPNLVMLNAVRLKCNMMAVTLILQDQDAFLRGVSLWDRYSLVVDFSGFSLTGSQYGTSWVLGENAFMFTDYEVQGSLSIAVRVSTDADAEVSFSGAGLRFHN
jgi:hypothetical protein